MIKLRKINHSRLSTYNETDKNNVCPVYDKTEKNHARYTYKLCIMKLRKIMYGLLLTYDKTEKNPVLFTANL